MEKYFNDGCAYRKLSYGPAVEISSSETVSLSPGQSFILLQDKSGDSYAVYFLDSGLKKEFHKKAGDVILIINDQEVGVGEGEDFIALNVRSGLKRRTSPSKPTDLATLSEKVETLRSGRTLSIRRLYANNYLMEVSPNDATKFEEFRRDILGGAYCGIRLDKLSPTQKSLITPLVKFLWWDALSLGKLDDYQSWLTYKHLAKPFLDMSELDNILEIYSYRSAESARSAPLLSEVDPDKVWSFAWAAAAELFNHKEFVRFSDISVHQRNGKITFSLLGTDKIDGVEPNRFGFYHKYINTIAVADISRQQTFASSWNQRDMQFNARVMLDAPANKADIKLTSFPKGLNNGLIVLDKTLTGKDVKDEIRDYLSYFKGDGFTFVSRKALRDVPAYIMERFLGKQKLDYLIREGHADGDDDNLMTIYDRGFVINGTKKSNGYFESVSIVFSLSNKAKERRIAHDKFADWIEKWHNNENKPFVFLNTSCWGIEKAWVNLSRLSSSRLIEVSSLTPVNYFTPSQPDATGILINGIRHGEDFESLRSKLKALTDYASGNGDNFVLPDEKEYPQMVPIVKIHRSLLARKGNGKARPYTPNGYF